MLNIGLLGFGVVGQGVYHQVCSRSDLAIRRILVRRSREEIEALAARNIREIVEDDSIHIVVEVMGGLHPAYEYICAALEAGKHVVTANKAVISAYYRELTELAARKGVALRCTAAAGGGIPWLTTLERCRRMDTIHAIRGIMNGTTNYILDAMHRQGADFDAVLHKAQALGYAEADPAADIDGDDIRRKLVISANIAFGCVVPEEVVPTFGIRTISAADVAAFQAAGFACKLLGSARLTEQGMAARVEPTLVSEHSLEASVPENYNLISYDAALLGRQSFFGQGAGRQPTAANVVQDCLDILQGATGFYTRSMENVTVDNSGAMQRYYVRTPSRDAWLDGLAEETMGPGIITRPVSAGEMLTWARKQAGQDGSTFIAALDA